MKLTKRRTLMARGNRGVLGSAVVFLLCAALIALMPSRAAAANDDSVMRVTGLDFTAVRVKGNAEVEIVFGDSTQLELRRGRSAPGSEPFYTIKNLLVVGETREGKVVDGLKIRVTATQLDALLLLGSGEVFVRPLQTDEFQAALKGSGDIRLHGVEADSVELLVEGSGDLRIADLKADYVYLGLSGSGDLSVGDIQARDLEAAIKGSGDIVVQGAATLDTIEASVLGSSDIKLKALAAKDAVINVMGSGDAVVAEVERLTVNIMGSGDVKYLGQPEITESVMGSGAVILRQDKD